jgi:hypothetical protein
MTRRGHVGIIAAFALSVALFCSPSSTRADSAYVAVVRDYVEKHVRPMVEVPIVLHAVEEQNLKFRDVSEMDIRVLDETYRSEVGSGDLHMIKALLGKSVSLYLKSKQDDSQGTIVEFFVTDCHGMNVGQSTETTDYWQGDEDKFLKTFALGSNDIFIDKAERDESTQLLETQASFTLKNEAGKPIGIATVTIAIDAL